MSLKITKLYSYLSEYCDKEEKKIHQKGYHPIDLDHLYAVRSHKNHGKLFDITGPAVIIAGSGMCTGGRIIDHLKEGIAELKKTSSLVCVPTQERGNEVRPGGEWY